MAGPSHHCAVHLAREATIRCDRCRRLYCLECLHRVQGGLVCTRCLDELERALAARSLPALGHRLPAVLLAIGLVVALVWGGSSLVGTLLGPAGSLASMECAAEGLASNPALHAGAPPPSPAASPATPVATVPSAPAVLTIGSWLLGPTQLVLHVHGAGFGPNGLVCVTGGLSGQGQDGRPRRDAIGPFGMQAGADGTFSGKVDFGSAPGGYPNGYTVHIGAAAGAGSVGVQAAVKGTTLTIGSVAGS